MLSNYESETLARAATIMERQISERKGRTLLKSPKLAQKYLRTRMGTLQRETFVALWLDNMGRLLEVETVGLGTLDNVSAQPRELLTSALRLQAAFVILAHNHPDGPAIPSDADIKSTRAIADLLKKIGVRMLDHYVVTAEKIQSIGEYVDKHQPKMPDDMPDFLKELFGKRR